MIASISLCILVKLLICPALDLNKALVLLAISSAGFRLVSSNLSRELRLNTASVSSVSDIASLPICTFISCLSNVKQDRTDISLLDK